MNKTIKLLIVLFALSIKGVHSAHAFSIDICISDNPQSKYVAEKLIASLQTSDPDLSISSHKEKSETVTFNNSADLVISIGTQATSNLLKEKPNNAIYSLMVPETSYHSITKKYYPPQQSSNISALYIDQPIARYLKLIKKIDSNIKKVGVFIDEHTKTHQNQWNIKAKSMGIKLVAASINSKSAPMRDIDALVNETDAIILMPNKAINRLSAKWILYSAYKHQKPVVAFSKRFINAGAISVIYSDLDDIVEEGKINILGFVRDRKFNQPPHYPEKYRIKHNDSVFQSLNLKKPGNSLQFSEDEK